MQFEFERKQVYDFKYAGKTYQNGQNYFLLTYDGQNSMPGYEADNWVFRTEILDFQNNLQMEVDTIIPCFVAGFIKDSDGSETKFPILKQDKKSILEGNFSVGKIYPFTVIACPGDLNEKLEKIDYYIVQDSLGFPHFHYTSLIHKLGETVELTVDKIENAWLKFVDDRQKIKELFEIGKEYEFLIESEEFDEKSGKNFFTLRDKIEGFLHRFYFVDGHDNDGPEDSIKLLAANISPKGWLLLVEPGKQISGKDLQDLEKIEDNTLGREDDQLEYKSSFVFTAGNSKQDIDAQLDREIMQQLAAFMNAKGGMVCLGYRDNGDICGINNDIQYLNSSTEDEYTYQPTLDGIELKIRSAVTRKLGGFANGLLKVEFQRNNEGLVVCHLIVPPSSKPIYLNSTELYKRSGNMCQRLRGDEITFFILDHMIRVMQNAAPSFAAAEVPAAATEEKTTVIADEDKTQEIKIVTPQLKVNEYFSFYKSGEMSRQKQASKEPDVLFNVPLTPPIRNNKSSRMLLCYSNGRVKFVTPKNIITVKLKKTGQLYQNGFCLKAPLQEIFTCSTEDFLVIRSQKNGVPMIKAVAVKNYAGDSVAIHTDGNKLLDSNIAEVTGYEIVSGNYSSYIKSIILKSKNSSPGLDARKPELQNAIAFLEKMKNYSDAEELRN